VAFALAAIALSSHLATASPYATCLTNNGDGSISFRLNQTTGTNDTVWVISGGGTTTNTLQAPSAEPANFLPRGLIVTNIGIAPGTVFQVRIKHTGSGVITTNSPTVAFNSPRGIAVNTRPASPYFGWVYVANSAAGTKGDGMFALSADLFDILGQDTVARTGGYNMATGGASAPYHVSVAPDDSVLVTDWSDAAGNVIFMPPDLSTFTYLLQQLSGTAAAPVGAANNHGSIISAFIVGSGASRKLYTMDEDYQTDPTAGALTELNSAWVYDIGDGPLPWANAPNRKIMTPYLPNFDGQNQKCEVYGHYLYSNQRRSNPPQHDVYITDLDNLLDPSTFTGATPWNVVWTSQGQSLAEGYSDDVLRDTMTISVSPDQKWIAGIIASGSNPNVPIVAPDGSTFVTTANDVWLIPLTNGIPNLPARQVFKFGGLGFGRDLAFDAAHNLYCVSSGLGYLQSLDIGETTDITTGSDGTFDFAQPPTLVTVAATTPVAQEEGAVPGVFTITRTADLIGSPVAVSFNIGGTARAGTNYVAIADTTVTLAPGQLSTNILVTPIPDGNPDPVLTVSLTIRGAGDYSVGFPSSATVVIADNSTPLLRITGLSTNVFQGLTNDYAALSIQRWGSTNVAVTLNAADFTFGGTAVLNTDYQLINLPYTIPAGVINTAFPLVAPIRNSTNVGSLSISLTLQAGTGFTVTNNTAATTVTLEAERAGTVLYSDDFETDPTGSNWSVAFQSYTNGSTDYGVVFDYDYTVGDFNKNLPPIPVAPHSGTGETKGLYMTVNKNAGVSAGLNLYLKNHTFSGNYALRFDLFLVENSAGTAQSKVEDVLFGINHDGAHTNWFRNSVTGTSLPGSPTESDGLFFDIGADGNGGGGAPYDFAAWSGPTWTNTVNVVGPTNFASKLAATMTQVFKRPPFDSGNAAGGCPANQVTINGFNSPTWVRVEVSQTGTSSGNLITWKINNTVILSYYNTNPVASSATSGTIMVGYCDPWDDLANGSAGSGEGCAIIDNLNVVALNPLPTITSPALIGGNFLLSYNTEVGPAYVVDFKENLTDVAWLPVSTNNGTGGIITVTNAALGSSGFYRVRLQ